MANENKNNKQYLFQMWKSNKYHGKTRDLLPPELMKVDEASVKSVCKTIFSLGMEIIEIETFEGALYTEKELKKFMNFKAVQKSDLELKFEAQQKELDELKSLFKTKAVIKAMDNNEETLVKQETDNDVDQTLIDEYKKVVGRKPYGTWDEATIRLKMKDFEENKEE